MPEDKIENLNEGMNFKEAVDDLKSAIKDDKPADLPEDVVNQMRISHLVRSMFKFPLGTKVKNRHGEEGYIELCGIDFRGEIYMVNMPNDHRIWYVPEELRPIPTLLDIYNDGLDESDDPDAPVVPLPKSDFPNKIKKDIPDIVAETKQLKEDIKNL